jgi:hypothetical protein
MAEGPADHRLPGGPGDGEAVLAEDVGLILTIIIPAQAGIHVSAARAVARWIPAFAGMTPSGWQGRESQGRESNE